MLQLQQATILYLMSNTNVISQMLLTAIQKKLSTLVMIMIINLWNLTISPKTNLLTIHNWQKENYIWIFAVLKKKKKKLSLLLDNIKVDTFVIGLTETWFTDDPHTMYSLPKHNLIFSNIVNRRGGGVAMYVPTHLPYIALNELNMMIHTSSTTIFWSQYILLEIQQLLSNPILQNKHCLLMGNFNVDLLKCNEDYFSQDFIDSILSHSFIPSITRPTRLSSHSCTLIDNIFSNVDKETKSDIILSDISDHCPIFAKIVSFFEDSPYTGMRYLLLMMSIQPMINVCIFLSVP